MALGIRVDPELELQLDQVARSQGLSRSACVREAIRFYVRHVIDGEEAHRQSAVIRDQGGGRHWSETVPDWTDWTA